VLALVFSKVSPKLKPHEAGATCQVEYLVLRVADIPDDNGVRGNSPEHVTRWRQSLPHSRRLSPSSE
jgi:hypothetical protein